MELDLINMDSPPPPPSGGPDRNAIIFRVDMGSSTKINNRKKYILILDKGLTQGLEHTVSAEKMYSINFTGNNKRFFV